MGDDNNSHEAPFPLTDLDRWILSQPDEGFKIHDWGELREIIDANKLDSLKRKPSDLRRYRDWCAETKAQYGSVTNFIVQNRLPKSWGTPPFSPVSRTPFADPSDYRVLKNDWPYGLTPDITHIVVWSRTLISTDPETGDLTPGGRELIRNFVRTYFVDKLGPGGGNRVMWFKNWVTLQSVRSLEHIHVLIKDLDPAMLEELTKDQSS